MVLSKLPPVQKKWTSLMTAARWLARNWRLQVTKWDAVAACWCTPPSSVSSDAFWCTQTSDASDKIVPSMQLLSGIFHIWSHTQSLIGSLPLIKLQTLIKVQAGWYLLWEVFLHRKWHKPHIKEGSDIWSLDHRQVHKKITLMFISWMSVKTEVNKQAEEKCGIEKQKLLGLT